MKGNWKATARKAMLSGIVNKAISDTYVRVKRSPDELLVEILDNNTTHFNADELQKLLLSFKRVTNDRFQVRWIRGRGTRMGTSSEISPSIQTRARDNIMVFCIDCSHIGTWWATTRPYRGDHGE